MYKFEQLKLFTPVIYILNIDPKSFDKEKIIKTITANYKKQPERNYFDGRAELGRSNSHHTYNDFNNKKFKKVEMSSLIKIYGKIFKSFFDNEFKASKPFKYSYSIQNAAAIGKDQYMNSHCHLPSSFSCVHYLKIDENNSGITFKNPNNISETMQWIAPKTYDILNKLDTSNSYFFPTFNLKPKEDTMLIFPSTLHHAVERQIDSKNLRVSVATNITLDE
jgi:uncharacterized protein (TIGR02466 family)|tara:strand:- start:1712 stop:2374 length:663 start_codon:yes stop_codon:yes gene_type:complete